LKTFSSLFKIFKKKLLNAKIFFLQKNAKKSRRSWFQID